MRTIPVIHSFDSNYVLPACVCFQSLLEHADTANARYALHVIGNIPVCDQEKLKSIVAKFPNATLDFLQPPPLPISSDVLPKSGHYSIDLYQKLAIPNLYPEYDKAIVADVDVVYQDDIAKVFDASPSDGKHLVSGVWDLGHAAWHRKGLFPSGKPLIKKYARLYSAEELDRLRIGAGLLVYDMKGLREGDWPLKWSKFAQTNAQRAILPEQEAINLTLEDKIRILPLGFMAIAEHASTYDRMTAELRNSNPSWDEMYAAPVQMHYASKIKPWKFPGCSRSELWFDACMRAGAIENWRRWYGAFSRPMIENFLAKRIFRISAGRFDLTLLKKRKSYHA